MGDRSPSASGEADGAATGGPLSGGPDASTGAVKGAVSRNGSDPVSVLNSLVSSEPVAGADEPRPQGKKRRRRRRVKAPKVSKTQQDETPVRARTPESNTDDTGPVYAAIDLGTNNCRLLVARKTPDGFRVIDAYSRIVRLGEGMAVNKRLADAAMERALAALTICADKMRRRGVTRVRSIATEACRTAENGPDFVNRVRQHTGIDLNIVSTQDEAQLALAGCAPLLDPDHDAALVFDIGGGSTELMWVRHKDRPTPEILDWTSLPCGVVTLAEQFGGGEVTQALFEAMVGDVTNRLSEFQVRLTAMNVADAHFHLLGTSGTVTTIAGVHLGLKRYDRAKVDGVWVNKGDVLSVTKGLLAMTLAERAAHPCVGKDRADLVLAGCAILEAISRAWPSERLRVADRGLREGILFSLMKADDSQPRRRKRRRKRRRAKSQATPPDTQQQGSDE